MTDRSIIFSGPMVRALLNGHKTQTRRLATSPLAKTQPGDRLWVRETWCKVEQLIYFRASEPLGFPPIERAYWKPSIHMPRWASRLTLVVTDVRLQHLQQIGRDDAKAEGCPMPSQEKGMHPWPEDRFREIWNSLHTKPGTCWDDNPAIVVLAFEVHQCNMDRPGDA